MSTIDELETDEEERPASAMSSVQSNDPRLEFISSFTLSSLRLKQDKWQRMMATDSFRVIMFDWLHNAQQRLLVMTLNHSGYLVPKIALSELHHNYAAQSTLSSTPTPPTTASVISATPTAITDPYAALANPVDHTMAATTATSEPTAKSNDVGPPSKAANTTSSTAIVASAAAVAAAAVLTLPMPPASSSFSTLDGVPRGKCVYFVRRSANIPLTAANFRTQILCGDLPVHSKIETLSLLFDEVFQPLLECPPNRKSWPKPVQKDLQLHIKEVRNMLVEIKGKTNNRTILSLLVAPAVIEEVATHVNQGNLAPAIEPKFRTSLEEMYINWTTQMHDIIIERSECHSAVQARSTNQPIKSVVLVTLPAHEIAYWSNRKQNLQNIYEQLRTPTHKTLTHILQSIDSPYYEPFVRVFKRLVCAWHEAEDNTLWLQPLLRQTAAFNAVNFHAAGELVNPLVHVLHLIWTHARYYRSTRRMTVLLRCVCQLLVRRASEDLDFPLLFQGDADEGLSKITKSMEVMEQLKSRLLEYKEKYSSNQQLLPAIPSTSRMAASASSDNSTEAYEIWRFSPDDVFGCTLNRFLAQLCDMRTLFEAAVSFQNLEKIEFGGLRGRQLNERVRQVHTQFKEYFEQWTLTEFGAAQLDTQLPSSSNWTLFKRQLRNFFVHIQALEQKLATIFVQAYKDCQNWEQLTKLTVMLGSGILQRGTILPELRVIESHLLHIYDEELQQLEASAHKVLLEFEFRGVSAIPIQWGFPPIAGALMWLEQHMQRIDALTSRELHNFMKTILFNADISTGSKETISNSNNMEYNETWHEEGVADEGTVNSVNAYRRLNTRRDILTTKLSNLQLKIWHNWQQTICKRIADGLDARVMSLGDNNSNSQSNSSDGNGHLSGASGNYTFGANFRSAITAALAHSRNHNSRNNKTDRSVSNNNNNNNDNKQNRSSIKDAPKSSAKAKSLQMNFSSDLFGLLQEVKHLLAMQQVSGVRRGSNDISVNNLSTFEAAGVMATTQAQHELENQSATLREAEAAAGGFEDSDSMELAAAVTASLSAATNASLTQQQGPNALASNLLDLYAERDEFWQRKVKLIKICEFYNGIRGLSTDDACVGGIIGSAAELQLIRHEVNTIDERVEVACATLTWRTYDTALMHEIYERSKRLYNRLKQTQHNLLAIIQSIRRWSREPLYQRCAYGRNLLDTQQQQERLRQRRVQCDETRRLLNRLLIANFCLFFDYDQQRGDFEGHDDQCIQEFLRKFPTAQRRSYNKYLAGVESLISQEVRMAIKVSLAYFHNRMVNTANENEELSTRATTTTPPTTHYTAANTSTAGTPAQVGADDDDGADAGVAGGTGAGVEALYASHKQPVAAAVGKQRSLLSPRPQTPLPTKPALPVAATPTTITTAATTTTRVMSAISISGSNSSAAIMAHQHLNRPSAVSAATAMPLFEVKLVLLPAETETQSSVAETASDVWHTNTEIRFVPSFNVSVENNFQQIVEQLLEDIHQTSHGCMPRRIVDDKTLSDDNEDDDDDGSAEDVVAHNGNNSNNNLNDDDSAVVDTVECSNNDYVLQAENLRTFARLQHGRRTEEDRKQQQTRNASLSTFHEVAVAKRLQLQELASKAGRSQQGNGDQTDISADELRLLNANIHTALTTTIRDARLFAAQFNAYAFLWEQQREQVLQATLQGAREKEAVAGKGYAIMEAFKMQIDRYNEHHEAVEQLAGQQRINGWLSIDLNPLKYALLNHVCKWSHLHKRWLLQYVERTLNELTNFISHGLAILQLPVGLRHFRRLLRVLAVMAQIQKHVAYADNMFKPLKDIMALLKSYNVEFDQQLLRNIDHLPLQWKHLKDVAAARSEALEQAQSYQKERVNSMIVIFMCRVQNYAKQFPRLPFFSVPCDKVYEHCDAVCARLDHLASLHRRYLRYSVLLGIDAADPTTLQLCSAELRRIKQLWDYVHVIEASIVEWHATPWHSIDTDELETECKKFTRDLRTLDKCIRDWAPYIYIVDILKELMASLRAITELQNPAISERHWLELMQATKLTQTHTVEYLLSFKSNKNASLEQLLQLQLHQHEEEIKNTVDRAVKEMTVTKVLDEIKITWTRMSFETEQHQRRTEVQLLKVSEELMETLDDNQMQLQNIATSKNIEYLLDKLSYWQRILNDVDALIGSWFEVQRKWVYLEAIFIGTADIRAQLPTDAASFEIIDSEFTQLLDEVIHIGIAMKIVLQCQHIFKTLAALQQRLAVCEKALNDYLETKRLVFPRFYFISAVDLLDILSNGNCPRVIDRHLIKLFDSILRLEYELDAEDEPYHAIGMFSKENDEYVRFAARNEDAPHVKCAERVELWLNGVIFQMRSTLHELFRRALHAQVNRSRESWLHEWPAQVALCCSQIAWAADVNRAFAWIDEGYEAAMKELHKRQMTQLNSLINLLLGELTPGDRQKIMTVCTIDVHSRDVVGKIIQAKVDNALAFQWQSQLRHRWDDAMLEAEHRPAAADEDCFANICDAEFRYAYEYLGNTSRLVITPLTDRCYITLTQSLHLVMGGAPAGPAGTGKTETTKDLGRALGMMVYVFNCSEQMDYKSCGNIYKGLAQTGAWGCFDEFNRIAVEVLSVVAVQVKTIQDAIKMHRKWFTFMGESIALVPSVGIFITLNPGYAGRTELPENLKTLFRPCAMVVPDFALICEIMLMAEGFQDARILARKFITLYTLCRELLSKQDHYDWGLRAIKSVLVVAGTLKRDDHSRPEDQVLMRALRDFNIPKIVTEDVSIFMGLIGDLFPTLDVPRKRIFDFEKTIRRAVNENKLQPEEGFLMKVVQLQDLLDVRHSVFIVGNTGTGKTKIWQTLLETYRIQKLKPVCSVLNPKALSNDELFGVVNSTTREWKDGLFSSIMREQTNLPAGSPKWIVLDGDIDPMWIESLNTLMDDNKILTLASNERITLKREMRLLFEVGHLKAATPATVSRAGILYINPQDMGWSPYVLSWIETRNDPIERGTLTTLFEKYFPSLMTRHRTFRRTTPISEMAMIQMTCHLLESLLLLLKQADKLAEAAVDVTAHNLVNPSETTSGSLDLSIELIFIYATMWGFGSALHQDHIIDWRREFHKWWISEFKDVKLPTQDSIFDYQLDVRTNKFRRWTELAAERKIEPIDTEMPIQSLLVHTAETVRLTYFLKLLIERRYPCMLVGNSGCGKSAIFRELFSLYENELGASDVDSLMERQAVGVRRPKLMSSRPRNIAVQTTYFNYYTTSEIFQKILERPLEKKTGRCYAPSGANRHLIYFINDLNMPEVDVYGTVQPHTIIRQFMDYRQWYDRQRLQLKDIRHCQFVACMNPTAGSFTIDPRLQRHFSVFSMPTPSEETLQRIFGTILRSHLENPYNSFSKELKSIAELLVQVGIALHRRVEYAFLPTAVKFHYAFNLRDLTNIYQGLMYSCGVPTDQASSVMLANNGTICSKPADLIRLYVHEAYRVYHDRLVDQYDIKAFKATIRDIFKKDFEDFDEDFVFAEPLIYSHFAQSLVDQKYMPLRSWDKLHQLLMEAQANYNEIVGYMNLVMFEDAMIHVCRINRILESPRGNALLIGVGGSGKQTLARLASFISSLSVFQIQLKRGFGLQNLKEEFATLYMKVGLKNVASVFLMSDAQIPEESLLMLINDLLASGEIPELFNEDQLDTIVNGIRNEVKQTGTLDTKENCWRFFIDKIRRLLKVVLCFSPVGQTLRVRARKFPAILSRASIDWFHEWPKIALESVSQKFLSEIEQRILPRNMVKPIGCFMAYVHHTVNQISKIYLQNEKRFNYTTPKTFLEYIFLYRKLLVAKNSEHAGRIQRLQSGMSKLAECACQVDALKNQLAIQEVQLAAKNAAADKLIVIVSAESEKVKREKSTASEEEQRVRIIEEDVCMKTKLCEEDLRKAEPALVAAQAALNTLNKNNLTELKSFGSPPKAVVNVCAAVMVLLAKNGKIPRDRSWKASKLMMVRVDQFLYDLVNYNKDNIHPNIIEVLQEYLKDPEFSPEKVVQKSVAAAGLCAWVINLHRYHQVFLIVGPKQQALQDSQKELQEARERLQYLKFKIQELEMKLAEIQAEFEEAIAAKQMCQREADKTAFTIDLAHRLINGLANENVRWKESVQSLQAKIGTLPGDILLISSFLSYVGCFTRRYREELQQKMWMTSFAKIESTVPYTIGVDPLTLLTDDAQVATWNNEGLPVDRMSTENATILTHSTRWPLMIDPQLQGIKWIKNRYGDALVIIRLNQKGFLDVLEKSMNNGDTVLIEQIGETIDTVLEPLLSRALIKKGRYIRIGGKEMDFNANFRLLLHTKLPNPHYKPEIQAQTTLINFTVTPDGLEEQLLAEVVKIERPDLEQMKIDVTVQQNKFKISLKALEDELLVRLATASTNVLDDHALVINLEATKHTVDEIELKVREALITSAQIDEARNMYRAAAKRAAILYFVLTDLSRINPIYKFSLKSFMNVFKKAISTAPKSKNHERRVQHLVGAITLQTFVFTMRGLFEADKLTFTSHMILRIQSAAGQISKDEFDFLLRFPHDPNSLSPLDFVSRKAWGGIKSLGGIEHFYGIDKDLESYPKRWSKFLASAAPEREQFPGEWKYRSPLQKLCIIRALRPDRMLYAMRLFVELTMGKDYTKIPTATFTEIYKEINAHTPVLFILSPGVNPIRDVELLGQQLGFRADNDTLINISLGQGQEQLAEAAIINALTSKKHWVVLQNIHLVVNWLPSLEKLIERIAIENETNDDSDESSFRLFISAEPAPDPEYHVIPQGILESSLKIVNEPPSGMAANLHKAWDNFSQETLETCTQEAEFKAILFALCYFHAVSGERCKFGPQGWNKSYPFNISDLMISANVLHNYLEGSCRIPWEDLRYLFGEIMYGGHITDDWDRRLCRTYLEELLQQELIDGDFELCPGFPAPPNLDYQGYHSYIDEVLPAESPVLYGLHANAEIGFLTSASEQLLKTIFELQPRESELSTNCSAPREELVKIMSEDFLDKMQDEFNLQALLNRVDRKTPFVVVALQECERMNALIFEIKRSLRELLLGLKGELTITPDMERLDHAIFYDTVPSAWTQLAYPSMLGLQSWYADLLHRIKELSSWLNDFKLPCTIWIGGLFNPQSFLTAIMQESARKHDLPLDRMCLSCEVTKKEKDDISLPPVEGALVHALYLDGASWDCQLNSIVPLPPKELLCAMPVIYIKSIVQEKQESQRCYECPLYKTRLRGSTYVWTFNLKTRERPAKWILGGVALLLQP
ncbi:dynein beta chain, ciliary [Bactrocera tryoni]|uniref:dynein beta chain, ciliary n=1 Tax=Bactrocera tryoni TaxID=59916 RepID=UPI001A96CA1F|nr:dynein beta chain, ciliary [Bactrocera tryoni]